ncbi:6397_t:CDS:2 [Funneliformis mosseae]|uniref:6397_t:CDS:1 n=1 Tax=Funneliformis mosseae TaxID=27381 RepID=A0A9N9CN97_FUNMO|nr:6397_t:CDS:2 [Funneliformis mosseae]
MSLVTSLTIIELFLLTLASLTLYTAHFYFRYFTRKSKVPGPVPLPIFGTLLYSYKVGTFNFIRDCYEKYGPIFEIYVGDNLITHREIYLSKPELLEKIFSNSTKSNFTLRNPSHDGMDELGFGKNGMVMNSDVASWKKNRMLSVPLLMNPGFLKNQVHVTQEMFKEMEICWKSLYDDKILLEFTSLMQRFSLDLVIASTLGKPSFAVKSLYNSLDGTNKQNENSSAYKSSQDLIRQVHSFFKSLLFFEQPAWLRHTLLLYYNNYYLNEMKSLNNSIENDIKIRREEIIMDIKNGINVQEKWRDIMSLFLLKYSITENQGKTSQIQDFDVTDDVIRSNLTEVFIGGADTTANSLSFTIYYLCKYPHVKKRLFDDIDVILSSNTSRDVTFEDIEKFEYGEAVIKEVNRMTPVAPVIDRSNVAEDEIGGYSFEAGTRFNAFMAQIYKNPEYFKDPEEFNPDRFMKGSENVSHKYNSYLPFGSGLRVCPGRHGAMIVMKTFLMCFLKTYDVEFFDKNQKLNVSFDVGFHCDEYKIAITRK